jgi:hypothetical protein
MRAWLVVLALSAAQVAVAKEKLTLQGVPQAQAAVPKDRFEVTLMPGGGGALESPSITGVLPDDPPPGWWPTELRAAWENGTATAASAWARRRTPAT